MNVEGPSGSIIPCVEPFGVSSDASQKPIMAIATESDQQYFSRRYEEESAAAERARSARARIAHLELALRYAQLAAAIQEVDERLGTNAGDSFNGSLIP